MKLAVMALHKGGKMIISTNKLGIPKNVYFLGAGASASKEEQ